MELSTTYALRCREPGCGEECGPSVDPSAGSDWAIEHMRKHPDHRKYGETIHRAWHYQRATFRSGT
ncbi:hypothetical protein [Streptomyces sp. SPB78]|uniref:DUF7848 domain-containing protein n=1 Tax=Streptomyces sp. (strain SPB78) TaxID=591157 RepID=UPI0002D33E60|nr:hypothetical protein [Streptomyces sp. SPB78]